MGMLSLYNNECRVEAQDKHKTKETRSNQSQTKSSQYYTHFHPEMRRRWRIYNKPPEVNSTAVGQRQLRQTWMGIVAETTDSKKNDDDRRKQENQQGHRIWSDRHIGTKDAQERGWWCPGKARQISVQKRCTSGGRKNKKKIRRRGKEEKQKIEKSKNKKRKREREKKKDYIPGKESRQYIDRGGGKRRGNRQLEVD